MSNRDKIADGSWVKEKMLKAESRADKDPTSMGSNLDFSRLTGTYGMATPGACEKCGQVGHLDYQCRNNMIILSQTGVKEGFIESSDDENFYSDSSSASTKKKKTKKGKKEKKEKKKKKRSSKKRKRSSSEAESDEEPKKKARSSQRDKG